MPASWQERLHDASSEAEVVELCRCFVAQFSPSELASLPEVCRPGKLVDGSDVTDYAFALVRHHCDEGVGAEYAAHRLSSFFAGATSRLSQILHTQSESGNVGQQSA